MKIRRVSNKGMIRIAIAIAGLERKGNANGGEAKLSSIKLIARIASIRPIINEPVSPINIFAGEKLYTRKASKELNKVKERIQSEIWL